MAFEFPAYHHPDFTQPALLNAPDARWEAAEKDGVAPEEYHSTSMYPEYFKINGKWTLAEESRMDSCVVLEDDGTLSVVESRNLKKGQRVIGVRRMEGLEFRDPHRFRVRSLPAVGALLRADDIVEQIALEEKTPATEGEAGPPTGDEA